MARRKRPSAGSAREAWGSLHPLLDLHGLTGDQARLRADLWLRARQAAGERTVVVVTGRGNRSGGFPVLRGEVEHLLQGLLGTVVSGFEPLEGGGGFQVRLLRPPEPAAPPPAGALARDFGPDLVRRAEEALWELGIAPTPALVRAEIRRILAEEGPVPEGARPKGRR
jgi:Smr domain-containing protein